MMNATHNGEYLSHAAFRRNTVDLFYDLAQGFVARHPDLSMTRAYIQTCGSKRPMPYFEDLQKVFQ